MRCLLSFDAHSTLIITILQSELPPKFSDPLCFGGTYNLKITLINRLLRNLSRQVSAGRKKIFFSYFEFDLKKLLPTPFYLILKSYLTVRNFYVKINNTFSQICDIKAGVPRGSSSRRGLASSRKSLGSYPRSFTKKLNMKNISSAITSQQILRVNKPAMKNFLKNLSFGVDVKVYGPPLTYKT